MLRRAGERAASLAAAREAQRYFQQAAELTDEPLVRAELDEKAGRMAWRRGRADEAVALLTEALAFLERENLKHPVARVSSVLAEIDFREGRASEAVERLERALAELRGEEPDADVAEASAQLGRFLIMSDALDAAVPHLELALVLAQALELREILVHALTSKSVMYIRTNRLEEARILLEGALATARTHDLPSAAIRAINNLSVVFESSDLFTAAADVADQGQELARRIGDKLWEVNFLIGGLSACVMVGRWEEAYPRAAEAEELVPGPCTCCTWRSSCGWRGTRARPSTCWSLCWR